MARSPDRELTTDGERRVEVYPVGRWSPISTRRLTFERVPARTWCCHHGVLLYGRDFEALAEHASLADSTTAFRGEDFVRRERNDPTTPASEGETGTRCYVAKYLGSPKTRSF